MHWDPKLVEALRRRAVIEFLLRQLADSTKNRIIICEELPFRDRYVPQSAIDAYREELIAQMETLDLTINRYDVKESGNEAEAVQGHAAAAPAAAAEKSGPKARSKRPKRPDGEAGQA